MTWHSALQSLARFTPAAVSKVIETLVPGAKPVLNAVGKIRDLYAKRREQTEKAEIIRALGITEEKLNAFDSMFILLGRDCLQLLERMDALEKAGHDSTDDILRAMLAAPELQERFDALDAHWQRLDGRIDAVEGELRQLKDECASNSAFLRDLKGDQPTNVFLADFRDFHKAKQLQSEGKFAESEPILLKLANTQPRSAAVAVALAVARKDDPAAFQDHIKRAVKLRPDDANLRALASAATVAVTGRHTPAARPMPPVHRVPKAGDTLDGWVLEARLGGGGWGIVFRATKAGRTRAVKVMRPDLTGHAELVEAFTDEAFKLLRLGHPNVVAVERNGFCTAFQCHYIVMPLLDGLTLESHLDRHGVPKPATAMGWLTGLLDGLEHAHASGLIHRDVKPQNVMIRPDGTPVLIDFGIAGLDGVAGHTQALGKSSFFAPPELHGLGQADARADLFMLAATLFYALRYDQPMKDRAWTKFKAERVPDPFRGVLAQALSADEDTRPANAAEMRKLLTPAAPVAPSGRRDDAAVVVGERRGVSPPVLKAGDRMEILLPGDVPITFTYCPPGTFLMGSPEAEQKAVKALGGDASDEARHSVTLTKGFYAGIHQVTVGQFKRFMAENPKFKTEAETSGGGYSFVGGTWKLDAAITWRTPGFEQTDAHPVVVVSHTDALKFIEWAAKSAKPKHALRLPTEAEWEYLCRAGTTTRYPTGDAPSSLHGYANVADLTAKKVFPNWTTFDFEDGYVYTSPVGSFEPNGFGLHDTIGNVWEWCSDWYDAGFYGRPEATLPDPECKDCKQTYRIVRGGSWGSVPESCRAAYRYRFAPGNRFNLGGFRVVFCLD